ncbi:hypothetical protein Hanom_Chr05g00458081 [Helianthus anomalus]
MPRVHHIHNLTNTIQIIIQSSNRKNLLVIDIEVDVKQIPQPKQRSKHHRLHKLRLLQRRRVTTIGTVGNRRRLNLETIGFTLRHRRRSRNPVT